MLNFAHGMLVSSYVVYVLSGWIKYLAILLSIILTLMGVVMKGVAYRHCVMQRYLWLF